MRLIYVNSSKVTKLEQKLNNSESFLLLLKNLLKCTYEVLLPSQRYAVSTANIFDSTLHVCDKIITRACHSKFSRDEEILMYHFFAPRGPFYKVIINNYC